MLSLPCFLMSAERNVGIWGSFPHQSLLLNCLMSELLSLFIGPLQFRFVGFSFLGGVGCLRLLTLYPLRKSYSSCLFFHGKHCEIIKVAQLKKDFFFPVLHGNCDITTDSTVTKEICSLRLPSTECFWSTSPSSEPRSKYTGSRHTAILVIIQGFLLYSTESSMSAQDKSNEQEQVENKSWLLSQPVMQQKFV